MIRAGRASSWYGEFLGMGNPPVVLQEYSTAGTGGAPADELSTIGPRAAMRRPGIRCAVIMTAARSPETLRTAVDLPVALEADGSVRVGSVPLILANRHGSPIHDPRRLSRAAERGELVRIRPGVYAEKAAWNAAYPKERHLASTLAVAATRRSGPAVFCRETALALHGVVLWSVPRTIDLRASHAGSSGVKHPRTYPGAKYRLFRERHLMRPSAWDRLECEPSGAADNEPPRIAVRARGTAIDDGACAAAPPDRSGELALAGVRMRVEPLGLVLADTIPRMAPVEAAVVLDALLGGRPDGVKKRGVEPSRRWTRGELAALAEWCTSASAREQFFARLEFATSVTESPGESASRVVIRDLGFAVPELQRRVHDRDGQLVGITDFWWKDVATVAEFDGLTKYLGRRSYSGLRPEEVIAEERRREDAICQQGLRMVRWLHDDVRHPAKLEAKLRHAGIPLA